MIKIDQYSENDQSDINSLIKEISIEFIEPISSPDSTHKTITVDKLWLARDNGSLLGTIGIVSLSQNNGILKSMFVKKEFRGENLGVSKLLLTTAINWSKEKGIQNLFLGTMTQFKAAQNFYLKNGFFKIDKAQLPSDFMNNPIDDLYYKLDLKKLPPTKPKLH
ncbi:GNAT family N-acetyltransferase [Kordia zhangzhouensis]|uniref:GNAT family N-acetyltransferase n=1 Tax=Kordia zhangzhouensis TaxID=1620405 RepID=UPI0012F8285F|nr:GNAT family N-acetyltransferase [Kordia zhangzhouensis]